ncbi:UNVERIFIED_CONTAM: hypothetical protein RMT77_014737 [Armadillidium vulgare]
MDIKHEAEFKVELLENTEDNTSNIYSEQLSTEKTQERNAFEYIDVKSEIEVKEEPPSDIEEEAEQKEALDIEEEEPKKYELSGKICGLDQNQSHMTNSAEEENGFEVKSTSRSRPLIRSSEVSQQKCEVSIEQMAREAQKSGLADDIVTGQLLGSESYSVNNNINTDSANEEDQDPFHNCDNDEVDPHYNTLNSGSESDCESRDEPSTGIEIDNANEPITRKRKKRQI